MAKNKRMVAELPRFKQLDEKGREVPDPTPMEVPAGFKRPETLAEQIRRLVRSEQFAKDVAAQGFETFEESEDFDIDDDMWDPSSPYEEVFDPVLGRGITLDEFNKNAAIYEKRYVEATSKAYKEMELSDALRGRVRRPREEQEQKTSRAASERVSSESNTSENTKVNKNSST